MSSKVEVKVTVKEGKGCKADDVVTGRKERPSRRRRRRRSAGISGRGKKKQKKTGSSRSSEPRSSGRRKRKARLELSRCPSPHSPSGHPRDGVEPDGADSAPLLLLPSAPAPWCAAAPALAPAPSPEDGARLLAFECASLCPELAEEADPEAAQGSCLRGAGSIPRSDPEGSSGAPTAGSTGAGAGAGAGAAGLLQRALFALKVAPVGEGGLLPSLRTIVGPPPAAKQSGKSSRYALATYLSSLMLYVYGLALLPYALTHQPEKLFWPLLVVFLTGAISVLVRTQLMIRFVPESTL